jgi:hypothetical protein
MLINSLLECNTFVHKELPALTMVYSKFCLLVTCVHISFPVLEAPREGSVVLSHLRPSAEAGIQQALYAYLQKE